MNETEAVRALTEAGIDAVALRGFDVDDLCSFENPRARCLTFWKSVDTPGENDLHRLPKSTALVTLPIHRGNLDSSGLAGILSKEPRVAFGLLAHIMLSRVAQAGIHPTATISPTAKVNPTAYIGMQTYVGDASVGPSSLIGSNCVIHDGVTIGANVEIGDATVIGVQGFGYVRLPDGGSVRIPHVGGVVIEDGVHIGANVTIERGTLDNTVLSAECRVGSLVHIAHNARIGLRATVISGAVLCGGAVVGADAWIAPQATVREHTKVGDRAVVGLGSVVWRDVADDTAVMGSVARSLPMRPPVTE
ncbi:MAG: hypothetical protein KGP10_05200 [Actinomycetales bacterium]|nr:hypothetical protein [Actinomycetales bacterium]